MRELENSEEQKVLHSQPEDDHDVLLDLIQSPLIGHFLDVADASMTAVKQYQSVGPVPLKTDFLVPIASLKVVLSFAEKVVADYCQLLPLLNSPFCQV